VGHACARPHLHAYTHMSGKKRIGQSVLVLLLVF
jgi:hypothetical protein